MIFQNVLCSRLKRNLLSWEIKFVFKVPTFFEINKFLRINFGF